MFNRRNAFLGWVVWKLAKRRLRQRLGSEEGAQRRQRVFRIVTVVGVLATLAALWSKRSSAEQAADETPGA
jgi:hypothetical protein